MAHTNSFYLLEAQVRLYVGNLQWGATDQDLIDLFAKIGPVDSVRVLREPDTGRSRGFGFVSYADRAHGDQAIKELDNFEFRGRPIRVSEARERPARSRF